MSVPPNYVVTDPNTLATGLPAPIPKLPVLPVSNNNLIHAGSDYSGGDDGNRYQAMWMTIACTNAIYQPQNISPVLTEIILEGSRAPFDDIEIKKNDDTLTLFQSKHRNRASGGNILISELVKHPGVEKNQVGNTKNDSAPFSLLKYFRGMMKLIKNGINPEKTRFIICASANFSNIYEHPQLGRTYLRQDFWDTTGLLNHIVAPLEQELLLSNVYFNNDIRTIDSFRKDLTAPPVKYVRFSEAFIYRQMQDPNAIQLRDYLWSSLNYFIIENRNKNKDWVYWAQYQDNDYIAYFFRKLQWWLNQPKLNSLQEILGHQLKFNFQMNSVDIKYSLVSAIERSARRTEKSLVRTDIESFFHCARGSVLARYLCVMSDIFREDNGFDKFISISRNEQMLVDFLTSQYKVGIFNANNPEILKYIAYVTYQKHYGSAKSFAENWLIVDAHTKPLFYENKVDKEFVEYFSEDIIISKSIELIIIDGADDLLNDQNGRNLIKKWSAKIVETSNVKIIFIINKRLLGDLLMLLPPSSTLYCNLECQKPELEMQDTKHVLSKHPGNKVEFFSGQVIELSELIADKYPAAITALTNPVVCIELLNESSKLVKPSRLPSNKKLENYQKISLPKMEAIYDLRNLCQNIDSGYITLLSEQAGLEKNLKDLTGLSWIYYVENKYYYHLKSQDQKYLILQFYNTKLEQVVIEKNSTIDPAHIEKIQKLKAMDFSNKQIVVNDSDLLTKSFLPRRILLTADYGSGKSTLITALISEWYKGLQNSYEWVFPLYLPKIINYINARESLVNIVEHQAIRYELASEQKKLSSWKKQMLISAIQNGNILLMLDGLDELNDDDLKIVKDWLNRLNLNISFIIFTRPPAAISVVELVNEKLSIQLFDWLTIDNYIRGYFENIYNALSNSEKYRTKHNEFLTKIFEWLSYDQKVALDILQRPLHVSLLCQALKNYYEKFLYNPDNSPELINAPWNDKILYRTKLYQLIIMEQLRKYLSNVVEVTKSQYVKDNWRMSLLTQPLQIKLREIAFKKIFSRNPVRIFYHLNEADLEKELDSLGFISREGEAEHRIFLEYFAAEYILFGLERDKDDYLYMHVKQLITETHFLTKYEQIWRILGEMYRYGNPFLNVNPYGKDVDLFVTHPHKFSEHDLIGSCRTFFRNCLNGVVHNTNNEFGNLRMSEWLIRSPQVSNATSNINVPLDQSERIDPEKIFITAKDTKNLNAISRLISEGSLTNDWLLRFYSVQPLKMAIHDAFEVLQPLIEKNNWNTRGGYWDIDVYLPAIKLMKDKLFIVAVAYYIHRIIPNYNYYSYGVTSVINDVFDELSKYKFTDTYSSLYLFIMLQISVRQSYILRGLLPSDILIKTFSKACQFLNDDIYRELAASTIYTLAFAFRMPVTIQNRNSTWFLHIAIPHATEGANYVEFMLKSSEIVDYLKEIIQKQKRTTDFQNMILPEWDWLSNGLWKKSSPNVAEISKGMLLARVGTPLYPPVTRQDPVPILPEVNKSALPKNSSST